MSKIPKLIKTKLGYYQFETLPSNEELQKYYRDKYYQEGRGIYQVSYSEDERRWMSLRAEIVRLRTAQLIPDSKLCLLDVGCGEGWLMDSFKKAGHLVKGIDFSSAGIEKMHPHLLDSFIQGDLYTHLDNLSAMHERYDVVSCCNVIEHVQDPARMVESLKQVVKKGGYLIIVAPNDFSELHEYLLKEKIISRPWWVCYPDHLSYFNKASMENFLSANGLKIDAVLADNPVDLNLLNDSSNYIEDTTKGKAVHRYRVRFDNLIASIDVNKLVQLYDLMGSMGIGRNLAYFTKVLA